MAIRVNLWNDYLKGDENYIYIENEVGHTIEKTMLQDIMEKIDEKYQAYLSFYEASKAYPKTFAKMDDPDMKKFFEEVKRWEIRFPSLSYEEAEKLIKQLKEESFCFDFKFYLKS